VALVGHRPAALGPDVAAELALVPPGVIQTTAPQLRAQGATNVARAVLDAAGNEPGWLHLDLDALDEHELPAVTYAQPQGLRWDELVDLVRPLLQTPSLVGVSLADFEPDRDPTGKHARRVIDALRAAWPARRADPA
jgi:arginase